MTPLRASTLCAAALLCVLALGAAPAARALQAQDTRSQAEVERDLARVREELRQVAERQQRLEVERDQAAERLRAADRGVGEAVRGLRETEAGIQTRERELRELEAEAAQLQQALAGQREALAALLRSAHAMGRHEQLKLLLAQDRIEDLARVLAYHRYVQADRGERIEGLLGELEALAALSTRVQARRDALAAGRLEQQARIQHLEAQRGERAELVGELEARHRDAAARAAALGRDEASLQGLLDRLRDAIADVPSRLDDATPLAERRGQLPWPLGGARLVGFGGSLPDGRTSRGWLLAGTAGAEVRAIAHGQVAFADWLKGYGLIVIIDHGGGWMSLYANNDALLKDAGDWVRGGEPVSTVGSSGGQGRPALYFELRRESRPVDPATWLQQR